jgi:tetratricopeptide (TPR) repeat protein
MSQAEREGNNGRLSVRGSRGSHGAALAVALLVFLVYCPALRNGFVGWDDDIYVYQSPLLRNPTLTSLLGTFSSFHASGNWHPLTELSHAADYALWGLRPLGHHLTSILLHGLNAGLVVALACALAGARARSAARSARVVVAGIAAGLFWGLHPLRVESAAWVSERKDLLCAAFYLAGLLCYLRYAVGVGETNGEISASLKTRNYLGALACFLLALLSKPMAVSFPWVLLVLDAYPLRRIERARIWGLLAEKLPFFALAAASAIVTWKAQRAGGSFRAMHGVPLATKVLVAVRSTVGYLGKTLWPSELLPLYSYPQNVSWTSWRFVAPVVTLALLVAGCVWLARRSRAVPSALACYLFALLPVIGIVQVGPQAMADRYTYLPAVALSLLVGAGFAALWEKAGSMASRWQANVLVLVMASVPGVLSWLSIRQMAVWHDSETLWSQVIRHEPWSTEAHNNRASYYYDQGDYQNALADYDAALSYAPPVGTEHATKRRSAYFNDRAITYVQLGRLTEAVADASEAIRLRPDAADYYQNRSNMYRRLGMANAAAADWQHAQTIRANASIQQPR